MTLRKYSADRVFNGQEFLADDTVVILGREGEIVDLVPREQAGEDVEHLEGILMPGLINAHCHLELSHMKGKIPEGTGMTDFILSILAHRQADAEEIQAAIAEADAAMYAEGIVAVGDICNTANTIPQKLNSRIHYRNFVEVSGFHPDLAEPRFTNILNVYEQFRRALPEADSAIVPHAPYSVSPQLFQKVVQHRPGARASLHNQECLAEAELFQDGSGDLVRLYKELGVTLDFFTPTGQSSLRSVLPYFAPEQQLLLVHNVTTTAEDLQFIDQHRDRLPGLYFCLCPSANAYIGNGAPNLSLLLNSSIPLVIGTDSLASNHRLSVVEEMRKIQRLHPEISLATLLQMATFNGARALGIEDQYGRLEKGMRPGLVVMEGEGKLLAKRVF